MSLQNAQKDAITLAIQNNPCTLCRTAGNPTCRCRGGKGSSGSGDGDSKNKGTTYTPSCAASVSGQAMLAAIQQFDEFKIIWMQLRLFSEKVINYDAGLLSVESDKVRGHLIFRPQSGSIKNEIELSQSFLKMIQAEFDAFKNQLIEQGISASHFTAILKDNELTIHIAHPKYYDAFIKHLDSKNLLPIPNPAQQEKKAAVNTSYHPISTRPSPFGDIAKGPQPPKGKRAVIE